MTEGAFRSGRDHQVTMVDRQKLTISGVEHVVSFNEETVVLATAMGNLTIRGRDLRIQQLNLGEGSFAVEGLVASLTYADGQGRSARTGGWQRFLR